jgi:putative hydrolase of the HAD superfamily
MPIAYLLLDLDKTIYPADSRLVGAIDDLMTGYVAQRMGVAKESAARMRRESFAKHGSTIRWLMEEQGLEDPEAFLRATHPPDVTPYLEPDPAVRRALDSIPLPKSILTNSTSEHVERVLGFYGVRDLFERVFDIRFNRYRGKPAPEAYRSVMTALGIDPSSTLFADDYPAYLYPFREMGGRVLLVSPTAHDGLERIDGISALPGWLEGRR